MWHARTLLLAVFLGVYVGLLGMAYRTWPNYETSPDWILWRALPDALATGHLYATGTEAPFVWSPVAGWFMSLVPGIYWPWLILHLVAVVALRDWRMIALVLASWGFWTSTFSGSPFIFVFTLGMLGHRGSRLGAVGYIALCLLMPRPVQLPLALWLVWKMPWLRMPAAVLAFVHAAAVVAIGYADDWILAMAAHTLPTGNWGPTTVLGLWWMLIGIPLGGLCFLRGRVGLAGLAISPYWLPEYLMMVLLDIIPAKRSAANSRAAPVQPSIGSQRSVSPP